MSWAAVASGASLLGRARRRAATVSAETDGDVGEDGEVSPAKREALEREEREREEQEKLFTDIRGDSSAALTECQTTVDEAVREALSSLFEPLVVELREPEEDTQARVLEAAEHSAKAVGHASKEMQQADWLISRGMLKTQARGYNAKLELMRRASATRIKHKAAEMQASFQTKLKAQVEKLTDGGGTLLKETLAEAGSLREQVEELSSKVALGEEALVAAARKQRETELQKTFQAAAADRVQREVNHARHELAEAIEQFLGSREGDEQLLMTAPLKEIVGTVGAAQGREAWGGGGGHTPTHKAHRHRAHAAHTRESSAHARAHHRRMPAGPRRLPLTLPASAPPAGPPPRRAGVSSEQEAAR
jgi:hypothetical protein